MVPPGPQNQTPLPGGGGEAEPSRPRKPPDYDGELAPAALVPAPAARGAGAGCAICLACRPPRLPAGAGGARAALGGAAAPAPAAGRPPRTADRAATTDPGCTPMAASSCRPAGARGRPDTAGRGRTPTAAHSRTSTAARRSPRRSCGRAAVRRRHQHRPQPVGRGAERGQVRRPRPQGIHPGCQRGGGGDPRPPADAEAAHGRRQRRALQRRLACGGAVARVEQQTALDGPRVGVDGAGQPRASGEGQRAQLIVGARPRALAQLEQL